MKLFYFFLLIAVFLMLHSPHGKAASTVSKGGDDLALFCQLVQDAVPKPNGEMPSNWREIWDASAMVSRYIKAQHGPYLFNTIHFASDEVIVPEGVISDFPECRVLARSVVPFALPKDTDVDGQKLGFGLVLVSKDGRLRTVILRDGENVNGIAAESIKLREPNMTAEQINKVVNLMIDAGFSLSQIESSLGENSVNIKEMRGGASPHIEEKKEGGPHLEKNGSDKERRLPIWIGFLFLFLVILFILVLLMRRKGSSNNN